MIFRNLDDNGDWTFGAGNANYKTFDAAIGLNIKTRLLSWVGDCFFDLTAGIDWSNRIGVLGVKDLLELDIRRIILQSEGVVSLVAFDVNVVGRAFSATYTINTIYGQEFTESFELGI